MHFLYLNLLEISVLSCVSFVGHQVLLSPEQLVVGLTGGDRPQAANSFLMVSHHGKCFLIDREWQTWISLTLESEGSVQGPRLTL